MSELTEDQKRTVANWVTEGAGLGEVQNRLQSEFGLSLTYMDVRFLVDDLDLDLAANEAAEPEEGGDADTPAAEANADVVDAQGAFGGEGSVSVEVDAIVRPGAMISGDVVFSDGNKAKWYVDGMGRLGLDPETPGYHPTPEDVQAFQLQLQEAVQRKGL